MTRADRQALERARASAPARWRLHGPPPPRDPLAGVLSLRGQLIGAVAMTWADRSDDPGQITLPAQLWRLGAPVELAHQRAVHSRARRLGARALEEHLWLECAPGYPPAAYLQQVRAGALDDPTLSWRLRAGAHLLEPARPDPGQGARPHPLRVVLRWHLAP